MKKYSEEDLVWASCDPTVKKYLRIMNNVIRFPISISLMAILTLIVIYIRLHEFKFIFLAVAIVSFVLGLSLFIYIRKKKDAYIEQILSLREKGLASGDEETESMSSEEVEKNVPQQMIVEKTSISKDNEKQDTHMDALVKNQKTLNLLRFLADMLMCAALLSTLLPFFDVLGIEDVSILKFISEYGFFEKSKDVGETFYGSILETFINAKTNVEFIDNIMDSTYGFFNIKEIHRFFYVVMIIIVPIIGSIVPVFTYVNGNSKMEQKVRNTLYAVRIDEKLKKRLEGKKDYVLAIVFEIIVYPMVMVVAYFPFAFGNYLNQESMGMITMSKYSVLLPAALFIAYIVMSIYIKIYLRRIRKMILQFAEEKK